MAGSFPVLEQYTNYMLAVLGRSELTVKEYQYDIANFFRFYKRDKRMVPKDTPMEEIDIDDVDVRMLNNITTDYVLVYLI